MSTRDYVRQARFPLHEIWDESGDVVAVESGEELNESALRVLLRSGPVHFVVADAGLPLRWIPLDESFAFWKRDVRSHLADPGAPSFRLEDFPGDYLYFATQWLWDRERPLVVLVIWH
ncbi:MAG: hypothetical protein AAGI52_05070 [Bacteroidota bacterium]